MPIYDRSKAVKSGFAQVREALQKFEGNVVGWEEGKWGGKIYDEDGNLQPPKEFIEISCVDVKPLEVSEELSMPIEEWNFRVNTSYSDGSFWVDEFLKSAEDNNIVLPDGIMNKKVIFKKVTKKGREAKYDYTNFVIERVMGSQTQAPKIVKRATPVQTPTPQTAIEEIAEPETETPDLLTLAADLAVGKTENQFRSSISLDPRFTGSPLVALAKAGGLSLALVNDGKLELVKEGNKEVYKRPE